MKVCLFHAIFQQASGGDRIMAVIADEMQKRGHSVSLATSCAINPVTLFKTYYNISLSKPVKTYHVLPGCFTQIPMMQELWAWIALKKAFKAEKPDAVFYDSTKVRKAMNSAGQARKIMYVHYPDLHPSARAGKQSLPDNMPGLERLYWRLFWKLSCPFMEMEPSADILLANSSYTEKAIRRDFARESRVVYPPIAMPGRRDEAKEQIVTALGMITPNKRFEDIIQAARLCKTPFQLYIIGSFSPRHAGYLRMLTQLVSTSSMNDRVFIEVNASHERVNHLLARSKICVSANHNEHFGMAVVEQMAHGCVPIVYRHAGQWDDIVEQGHFGFGYTLLEELAKTVDSLLQDAVAWGASSSVARRRAQDFSEEIFRQRIAGILEGCENQHKELRS